ncbi:hypothetical protein [Chryseobacterium sp. SIMBA_029]
MFETTLIRISPPENDYKKRMEVFPFQQKHTALADTTHGYQHF